MLNGLARQTPPPPRGFAYDPIAVAVAEKVTSNDPVEAPIVTGPVAVQVRLLVVILQVIFPEFVTFVKLPTVTGP